ncbi:MAG: DUF3047 domain-containing protein [Candidatus Rokubacteria bacterium]|nr:DUF3047 domain-containing protein [Candidatus Rokubacteria bacterium]MBI3824474.1 DUF3047 domain-containing protein [Candidatus Rokubacteria bacterium]
MTNGAFRLALTLAVLGLAAVAWGQTAFVVEDWASIPAGTKGVPPGWKGQNWGSPANDFTVLVDDPHHVLHAKSAGDGSTISKDIKGKVKLKQTPIIEWSWKVVTLPTGANACKSATDDEAGQIYVTWRRFPELVRSRVIGYIWDTTAPVGTICKSEKTSTVTYIVVRSGPADLGKWLTEHRNVADDFKKIFEERDADDPDAISIGIDSNDTKSQSEAFVGTIRFRP